MNRNAARNAHAPTPIHLDETGRVDAQSTRRLHEKVLAAHPDTPRIYVVCDNAHYYKDQELTEWLVSKPVQRVSSLLYSPSLNGAGSSCARKPSTRSYAAPRAHSKPPSSNFCMTSQGWARTRGPHGAQTPHSRFVTQSVTYFNKVGTTISFEPKTQRRVSIRRYSRRKGRPVATGRPFLVARRKAFTLPRPSPRFSQSYRLA